MNLNEQCNHQHGPQCNYGQGCRHLMDDDMHVMDDDMHVVANEKVPLWCDFGHNCHYHDKDHRHGPDCGHLAVSHDGHIDYLVNGHLHHPHGNHCDNHGRYQN